MVSVKLHTHDLPIVLEKYWIFPEGRIVNVKTMREVRSHAHIKSRSGKRYCGIKLWHKNKRFYFLVHRLVAQAYCGDVLPGLEVNHIDRNPLNNHYLNLEVVTPSENQNDWRKKS